MRKSLPISSSVDEMSHHGSVVDRYIHVDGTVLAETVIVNVMLHSC